MEKMKDYKVFFPNGKATERLMITPLGHNLYRMEETALSEEPIFYHDTIEASWSLGRGLCFRRVVEKSGLRVFRFLLSKEVIEANAFQVFLQRVSAHDGHWEQIFGGILIVHLPRGSACQPKSEIRAVLRSLSHSDLKLCNARQTAQLRQVLIEGQL
jgi:hypothetical protein